MVGYFHKNAGEERSTPDYANVYGFPADRILNQIIREGHLRDYARRRGLPIGVNYYPCAQLYTLAGTGSQIWLDVCIIV